MKRTLLFIPYYNDFDGLTRSIKSIPSQSDIDLLIVDDGSKNKFDLNEIADAITKKNLHFEVITHKENKGVAHTRNQALSYFKSLNYEYLMFLDCGDEIASDRIKLQIDFLDENSDCMIVGSHVHFVNQKGDFLFDLTLPTSWKDIQQKMFFNSMLIQPAVTLRSKLLETIDTFPTNYDAAEDYAFFMAVAQKFRVDNIPKFLTTTFVNLKGISNTNRKKQVLSRIRVILKYFQIGYYPIVGLLRSSLLLFLPLTLTAQLKGFLYSNESKK